MSHPGKAEKKMQFPAFLISLFILFIVVSGSDPDPLQDICAADFDSQVSVNGFACKSVANHTIDDFVSRILRKVPSNLTPNSFKVTPIFVQQLAGLNTAGLSIGQVDLGPGAVNVPHVHPRATEVIYMLEGKVQVGFVSSDNNLLFSSVLEKGDVMVIPRGVVHFQLNLDGTYPARFIATFNSQNPGAERLPGTLFGTGIPNEVLEKSFKLSPDIVADLKKQFTM